METMFGSMMKEFIRNMSTEDKQNMMSRCEKMAAMLSAGGTCDPNPAAVTFGLRMRALADVLPEYGSAAR